MKTNFCHLKGYYRYYKIALEVEDVLSHYTNQTRLKMAGNSMRQILEGMLIEMAKKYGKNPKRTFNLLFKDFKKSGVLDKESVENIEYIQQIGNDSSHPTKTVTEQEIHKMYELLYRETYKIVVYYLKEQTITNYHVACIRARCEKERKERQAREERDRRNIWAEKNRSRKERRRQFGLGLTIAFVSIVAYFYVISFYMQYMSFY